jgi:hypothetical protein
MGTIVGLLPRREAEGGRERVVFWRAFKAFFALDF